MKAIDTNVIVRFLAKDDESQSSVVRGYFESLAAAGEQCLVLNVVVLELVWVLESVYGYARDDVAIALTALIETPCMRLENASAVRAVVNDIRTTRLDISDLLIGHLARGMECSEVLTFDRGASKHPLFARIDQYSR
jgi:predicted nucleic-acid-binding protein